MNIIESLHSICDVSSFRYIIAFFITSPRDKVENVNPHVPPHVPIWLHESVNIPFFHFGFLASAPEKSTVSSSLWISPLLSVFHIPLAQSYPIIRFWIFNLYHLFFLGFISRLRLNNTPRLNSAFLFRPLSALRLFPLNHEDLEINATAVWGWTLRHRSLQKNPGKCYCG